MELSGWQWAHYVTTYVKLGLPVISCAVLETDDDKGDSLGSAGHHFPH